MTTLNNAIADRVALLKAQIDDARANLVEHEAALNAEIAAEEAKLTALAPWLEREVADAKAEILAFFSKYGV